MLCIITLFCLLAQHRTLGTLMTVWSIKYMLLRHRLLCQSNTVSSAILHQILHVAKDVFHTIIICIYIGRDLTCSLPRDDPQVHRIGSGYIRKLSRQLLISQDRLQLLKCVGQGKILLFPYLL